MRLFKSDWVERVLLALKVPDDVPIENKQVSKSIASAQGQVESQNFESRKNVLKYDDVMSRQREVIYGERREVLEGADLESQVRSFIDDVITGYVNAATQDFVDDWDLDKLTLAVQQLYPASVDLKSLEEPAGGRENLNPEQLSEVLRQDAHAAYDKREVELGAETMREVERRVLLSVLDRKWREHLYEMDYLREGIYLRAYSQRDPLVEYQREGFDMFAAMMEGIKEESVGFLFNLEIQVDEEPAEPALAITRESIADLEAAAAPAAPTAPEEVIAPAHPLIRAKGLERPATPQRLSYSAPTEDGDVAVTASSDETDEFAGVGRNAACPCGSGKKYKKCHGAPGGPTGLTTRVSG